MASKADAFDVGDYVVYPKHGVGRVIELQSEEIAGMQLDLYVLRFEKERMTLRVPVNKVEIDRHAQAVERQDTERSDGNAEGQAQGEADHVEPPCAGI